MLPEPLHPAVVHFPLVLAFLLPLFVVGAIWFGRRSADSRRTWAVPLFLAAALAASSFLAVKSGEREEDRVEKVLPDGVLHTHEEAAERFLVLSGVLLLIAGAGLVGGNVGRAARFVTLAGSLGVTAAAIQVGKAGGDLVYRHNAATVYSDRVAHPADPAHRAEVSD